MNKKDFPISIPLRDHRMKQITGVVQNDVGSNRLILTLLDGNTPFDYTGYTNITFTVQKPNGTVYIDSLGERIRAVSPEKGQIEIILGNTAIDTPGNHTAVVELYSSDVRITSARFAYTVLNDLAAIDDPAVTNALPVLQNLINDVTELEESVGAAESARVSAEEGRVSAESGRVQAEEGRVSAETQRDSAESARQTAEAQRQANEAARISAESARASAESARVSAEANRNTVFAQKTEAAENAAAAANAAAQEAEAAAQEASEAVEGLESWKGDFTTQEAQRQANEAIRQSNETARAAAENTRNSAETQRNKAEAGRVSAEKQRESAESAREAAESARVQAENQRINTFAEEVAQAEAAREAAQGARTAAETAKTLAETAQANAEAAETGAQGYAQAAQSSASAASGSKDAAVLAAQGAESSANAAASAKTDAEAAKTAAETAQTNAESAASSAAQSESNAAQSAQAASGSATAAESAKTAAQTAQGAAETAKSNAEASATAAAGSQAQAASSAATANASAVNAQSWAVGGTGTREGENTNNAKYWCESAAAAAGGGVTSFNGRSGAVSAQTGDYDANMVGADAAGTAASAVSTHNAAADAHSSLFGGKADVNHSHDGVYQPAGSYLTSETDPTVPAWAKAAAKPAYTASEVGADTAGSAAAVQSNLDGHTGNTANPHSVTKDQVGLGNVDNTSDADKPVSTAMQTALNGKSNTDHNHAGVYQPVGSYLTSETDPTVPAWAKAAVKPAYTAAEVGADAAGSAAAVQSNLDAHTGNSAPHNHVLTASVSGSVITLTGNVTLTDGTIISFITPSSPATITNPQIQIGSITYPIKTTSGETADEMKGGVGYTLTYGSSTFFIKAGGGAVQVDYTLNETVRTSLMEAPEDSYLFGKTAVTDGNGDIVLAGWNNNDYNVYKYTNSEFIQLSDFPGATNYPAGVQDSNGDVIFAGGHNNRGTHVVKYTKSGTKTTMPKLVDYLVYPTAAIFENGDILFADESIIRYTPSGTQTRLDSIENNNGKPVAASLGLGDVILIGNDFAVKYANNTSKVTQLTSHSNYENGVSATDKKGYAWFTGGDNHYSSGTIVRYSPNGVGTITDTLPHNGLGTVVITDSNGDIVFAGGGYTTGTNQVIRYSAGSTSKDNLPNLSKEKTILTVALYKNLQMMFFGNKQENYNEIEIYDYVREIPITAGSKYKFNEHSMEQIAQESTILQITTPNNGYIKYNKGSVTI